MATIPANNLIIENNIIKSDTWNLKLAEGWVLDANDEKHYFIRLDD